jgi:hypothetical protein
MFQNRYKTIEQPPMTKPGMPSNLTGLEGLRYLRFLKISES